METFWRKTDITSSEVLIDLDLLRRFRQLSGFLGMNELKTRRENAHAVFF